MISIALIALCSVQGVSPSTIQQIIQKESQSNALAIGLNINKREKNPKKIAETNKQLAMIEAIKTKKDAIRVAEYLKAKGRSFDVGLMQINNVNLRKFQISYEDAFEPCRSIQIGSLILKDNYERASTKFGPGQLALKAALSQYNTGDFFCGFLNGYVGRYYPAEKKQRTHYPKKLTDGSDCKPPKLVANSR